MKSAVLIVLDGVGVGCTQDAVHFGDEKSSTLFNATQGGKLALPNLQKFGLYSFLGDNSPHLATCCKLSPKSNGKSTVEGHWEMMGIVKEEPFPIYPKGFPKWITSDLTRLIGRGLLWGKPASGTEIIDKLGAEHIKTGKPILYTSADSVMQIAAHEDIIPVPELYEICRRARRMMSGENAVARVIARPFAGHEGHFVRTHRRKDFTLQMPIPNDLSRLKEAGIHISAVGRITDLFEEYLDTYDNPTDNAECLERTKMFRQNHNGFVFTNLEDFDMKYGHRRDREGFANALVQLDKVWPKFLAGLSNETLLVVTSDHGCDPCFLKHTDHTRENVIFMGYMRGYEGVNCPDSAGLEDVGATILDYFGVSPVSGKSKLPLIKSHKKN